MCTVQITKATDTPLIRAESRDIHANLSYNESKGELTLILLHPSPFMWKKPSFCCSPLRYYDCNSIEACHSCSRNCIAYSHNVSKYSDVHSNFHTSFNVWRGLATSWTSFPSMKFYVCKKKKKTFFNLFAWGKNRNLLYTLIQWHSSVMTLKLVQNDLI